MMRLIILIALAYTVLSSYAQTPYFRKHALPLEYKNAEINCIVQDKNHFIWLGTSVGLVRFDGVSYKHFLQFPGSENHVSTLFEDSKGRLLVGYKNGIIGILQDNKFTRAVAKCSTAITDFTEDKIGTLWAATYGEGILVMTDTDTARVEQQAGLSDDYVYTLTSEPEGYVIAGTDQGLSVCTYASGKLSVTVLDSKNGLPDNIVTALTADTHGNIFFGTESAGVYSLDLQTQKFTNLSGNWTYGRVTSLLTTDETLWAGTSAHGVIEIYLEGKAAFNLREENQVVPTRITDQLMDGEGNIWLAGGASYVLSGNRMFSITRPFQNDESSAIQAILSAHDNTLWLSTRKGVFFIEALPQKLVRPFNIPELKGVQVISLFQDEAGMLWFGTFDKGIIGYDPGSESVVRFTEKDGLVNNNVLSIAGSANELWLATLGGVSRCTITRSGTNVSATFINYTSEHGLASNFIYKIYIDSQNRIWFATDGKGVTMLENNQFKTFSLQEGLRSNIVYSVTEDSAGTIWVSTANAGIFRFNGSSFQSFNPHNGLRDLAISSIVGDRNGNLLIASKQGIDLLNPSTGTVYYHGDEVGITAMDPNLNAYTFDRSGNIWLGTDKGIVLYNTHAPSMNKWPHTSIHGVQVFLSQVDSTDHTFSYDENHISFDYMGFWYHDPPEVSYKIKLEGYDREWTNSRNHFITYPNLPPGHYVFKVQSSATNYFDGAEIKSFAFTIAPPFYQTFLFFVLCLVTLFILLYAFIKTREKRIRSRELLEKEKLRFQLETLQNQVNPHFLFNSFNTLLGVIEEHPQSAAEYVERLSDFYREILVNREKDLIRLSEELVTIDNYAFLQAQRYKSNFKIAIDIPQARRGDMIPPLTLQLLVENAVKHNIISTEKPLTVHITIRDTYVLVSNTLQPKLQYEPSTGVGLMNITRRFSLLTDRKVRIEENAEYFSVYVPLLTTES